MKKRLLCLLLALMAVLNLTGPAYAENSAESAVEQETVSYEAAKLAAPKISKVENAKTGVKVTWGKVSGASKYRLYYKEDGTDWKKITTTTKTSYTWTKAKNHTGYYFRVRALDSQGKLSSASASKYIIYYATPAVSKVENTESGVRVTWSEVPEAPMYRLYYRKDGGDWTKITDTGDTSYTWKKGKSGTEYSFSVRVLNRKGKLVSAYGTSKSIVRLAAPKLSEPESTATGVKLSWGKVTGATYYRVYYKTAGGDWTKITDTKKTNYTWKKAEEGTKYDFSVRALSSSKKSLSAYGDSVSFPESSAKVIASGKCGEDVKWKLTGDGVLTISGSGAIDEYFEQPGGTFGWNKYGEKINRVVVESGVTNLPGWVFNGLDSMTSVSISNTVTYIGECAFQSCYSLASVTIPKGVTVIDSKAFNYCEKLTSVTIPSSVTDMGGTPFNRCSSLTAIKVASGNKKFTAVDGVLFNAKKTRLIQYPGGKTGAYTIPSTVTRIDGCAFEGSRVSSVTIPAGVTDIGDNAFICCLALTEIQVASANECYSSKDGVLFNAGKTTLIQYPCAKAGKYKVPSTVQTIGKTSFEDSILTAITIPNSVTTIDSFAFFNSGLTSVTIPASVTWIGTKAFGYNSAWQIVDGFTISGYKGSAAEAYAEGEGIPFKAIG